MCTGFRLLDLVGLLDRYDALEKPPRLDQRATRSGMNVMERMDAGGKRFEEEVVATN